MSPEDAVAQMKDALQPLLNSNRPARGGRAGPPAAPGGGDPMAMLDQPAQEVVRRLAAVRALRRRLRAVLRLPAVKVVQMSFTDAPLIGDGDWVGLDNYKRSSPTSCSSPRSEEQRLLRPPDRDPDDGDRALDRADDQPAEGPAAGLRAGDLLPALHPAGLGRHRDLALDARLPVRRAAAGDRLLHRQAGRGVQEPALGDADGRAC